MNARACSSVGRPSARFIVPVLLLAAACGGETAGKGPKAPVRTAASTAASCNRGDTTATYVAYLDYIKKALPTPQRFLKAAGTDSSVPDDGFRAMQDQGPSYFYGGDRVAQWLALWVADQEVMGSNPTSGGNYSLEFFPVP
jgi:hypothetical protein